MLVLGPQVFKKGGWQPGLDFQGEERAGSLSPLSVVFWLGFSFFSPLLFPFRLVSSLSALKSQIQGRGEF